MILDMDKKNPNKILIGLSSFSTSRNKLKYRNNFNNSKMIFTFPFIARFVDVFATHYPTAFTIILHVCSKVLLNLTMFFTFCVKGPYT